MVSFLIHVTLLVIVFKKSIFFNLYFPNAVLMMIMSVWALTHFAGGACWRVQLWKCCFRCCSGVDGCLLLFRLSRERQFVPVLSES